MVIIGVVGLSVVHFYFGTAPSSPPRIYHRTSVLTIFSPMLQNLPQQHNHHTTTTNANKIPDTTAKLSLSPSIRR